MKRIFSLLVLGLILVSCNKNPGDSDCTTNTQAEESGVATADCTVTDQDPIRPEVPVETDPGDTGLPNEAYTFDVNIQFFNTNATQREKFDKAIEIIKRVVATEEFRNKILNHTYDGKKTFVDNGGFTNAQIYQKILDGAETLQNVKDNEMDMEVELYYKNNSTVGYTYANSKRVWVNTKFFNTNAVTSVAANLMHEWLHKLGFTHASNRTANRDQSVPYAIGYMVGEIGKKFD